MHIQQVAQGCTHLPLHQRNKLAELLSKFPTLFDGTLKKYSGQQVHLELINGAESFQTQLFTLPGAHEPLFKMELDKLVQRGVLEWTEWSKWMAGTFIVPKKDGLAQWVSDFCSLNKQLRCHIYPMPQIADILAHHTGYKFLTTLDISMQYYTFALDKASSNFCTIITPFSLYKYKHLPMGIHTLQTLPKKRWKICFAT